MANTDTTDPGSSLGATQPQAASGRWDKLSICQQALINTANNPNITIDDGSDEWRVASSAFDQWLQDIAYDRNWSFLTKVSGSLQRVGDSLEPGYGDVYAKPADCIFLIDVWRADLAAFICPAIVGSPSDEYNTQPPPLDYAIIGDQIHTTAANPVIGNAPTTTTITTPGDFVAPTAADPNEFVPGDFVVSTTQTIIVPGSDLAGIICRYVAMPDLSQPWSIGFVAALRAFVEAICYRGLNEDLAAARDREAYAKLLLDRAASRDTQQQPRRVAFRSRLNERRRVGRYGSGLIW